MSSLRTALCDLLGIEYPVVQAPVGSVSTPELAAAVADAGGLGMLAMSWRDTDAVRETFERATASTDGVVGVNVVLDEATGVDSPTACLDACLDAGATVVSFSFGDPSGFVERVHDAGGLAMVTVGSAADARRAADLGADVVVAQGSEAGGHVQSDVTTMALVPRVADAVDVPVVAAGGIGDGRGLAAALALGADGAWLGTRFVATRESGAHESYRGALRDATETDTRRTTAFDRGWPGQPHRALATAELRRGERDDRPGDGETVAHTPDGDPVERYADLPPVEGTSGDVDALPHYAGQSVGLADGVPSAGRVVDALVSEATAALRDVPRTG
ncbi:NAD(P)H-dependent flavin oxidoreductase [Haloarcula halophila]|uniref:NAD(P)H-dependent flavin oxidoreductase n=1 Tax=Haloarcula TaxID=2237 RepID=UPI0023E419EA|nr:nitronate monooxygenase [Halomicroarcula sp. DFY41]